jgi:hypothetical protein
VELVRECRRSALRVALASSADWIKVLANLRQIGLPPEDSDVIVTGENVNRAQTCAGYFPGGCGKARCAACRMRGG